MMAGIDRVTASPPWDGPPRWWWPDSDPRADRSRGQPGRPPTPASNGSDPAVRQVEAAGGVEFRPDLGRRVLAYVLMALAISVAAGVVLAVLLGDVRAPGVFAPAVAVLLTEIVVAWRRVRAWSFATDRDLLLKQGRRTVRWLAA